jgi:eukaryotic-like serine/threonine-protein kinase
LANTSRSTDPAELMAAGNFVQAGRIHESRHRIHDAIDAYARGAAWAEAARLLAFQGKFADAGRMLLRILPDRATPVVRLTAEQKREALNAALLFARGGGRREAVGLLMNLGQHQRAAGLLQMAGLRQDAVRAMRGEAIEGSPWPPGVLNSMEEEAGLGDDAPNWSQGAVGETDPAQKGPAPWEGRKPAGASKEVSREAPVPPWKRAQQRRGATDSGRSSVDDFEVSTGGNIPAVPPAHRATGATPMPPSRLSGNYDLSRSYSDAPTPDLSDDLSAPYTPGYGAAAPPPRPPPPLPRSPARAPAAGRGSGRMLRAQPGSLLQQELASFVATNPQDRSYPLAVRKVVELVWPQELLPPRVIQFLDDYLRRQAAVQPGQQEWPTLYGLARLYEFHDRMDGARSAYRALLGGNPGFADGAMRLNNLEDGLAEASDGNWHPIHLLIDGLHQFARLPSLDQMPGFDLDSGEMPAPNVPTASRRRLRHQDTLDVGDSISDGRSAANFRPQPPKVSGDETMDFDDYLNQQPEQSRVPRRRGNPASRGGGRDRTGDSNSWAAASGPSPFDDRGEGGLIEGVTIANRYQIEGEIGSGGMATVYSATDLELEETVALKVFQQVVQNRAGLDRFRREMKLSRKLVHPNIVRIYEFGTWRGARFITMELLRGADLEGWMEQWDGPCPHEDSLRLLMQACDGLGAAHAANIVHRDVKPQNLFVVDEGRKLKVMDFGIAKVNDSAANISVTGVRVGTPRYMSPEQIQGDGEVGPAADLYALGGVAYEMFTGTPVFQEEELVPLLLSHMTEEPEPPRSRNATVPPDVEAIINRLLKKKPEDRYADCAELKKALLQAYVASQRR